MKTYEIRITTAPKGFYGPRVVTTETVNDIEAIKELFQRAMQNIECVLITLEQTVIGEHFNNFTGTLETSVSRDDSGSSWMLFRDDFHVLPADIDYEIA